MFAVRVTEAPGANEALKVSENDTETPPTLNSTPWVAPLVVATAPWFLMVAVNWTGSPAFGAVGVIDTLVTTRSGFFRVNPAPIVKVTGPPPPDLWEYQPWAAPAAIR